eukprot:6185439-Pleurochrysis_carterae.AAC.2
MRWLPRLFCCGGHDSPAKVFWLEPQPAADASLCKSIPVSGVCAGLRSARAHFALVALRAPSRALSSRCTHRMHAPEQPLRPRRARGRLQARAL